MCTPGTAEWGWGGACCAWGEPDRRDSWLSLALLGSTLARGWVQAVRARSTSARTIWVCKAWIRSFTQ